MKSGRKHSLVLFLESPHPHHDPPPQWRQCFSFALFVFVLLRTFLFLWFLAAQHDTQIYHALVPPPSLLHGAHGGADGAREDAGAVSGLVATLAFGAIGNSTKKT